MSTPSAERALTEESGQSQGYIKGRTKPSGRDGGIVLTSLSRFATALLALLGTVGETLKFNTSETRTHSLFRQGCMLYV